MKASMGKTGTILTFTILSILSLFLLINNFDKNIFSVSTIESIQIASRRQYWISELGKLYGNRIGIFYFDNLRPAFAKVSNNFFFSLDLNLYFSHQLLTGYGKYPLLFAPFFIIGFLSFLVNIKTIPAIYVLFVLSVSTLTNPNSKLGPLLMLPFIGLCIAIGAIKLFETAKRQIFKV